MPSILAGYEYDIFISYRHNDNRSGWVTEFVKSLQEELAAIIKEPVSVYFDVSPHDGLLEMHNVDKSLERKLKCLVFIPVISQTYCDPKSFAWQNEFRAFNRMVQQDQLGRDVMLLNRNVASRILPIKIHELDPEDKVTIETELGHPLRTIDFVFGSSGVSRPLTSTDNPDKNIHHTFYRDQINKTAKSIKDIFAGLKNAGSLPESKDGTQEVNPSKRAVRFSEELNRRNVLRAALVYLLLGGVLWKLTAIAIEMIGLPAQWLKMVSLGLIILFPISVLVAWLYERSPQGFIRSGSTLSLENTYTPDQKKPFTSNTIIVLLSVTLIALFLLFQPGTKRDEVSNLSGVDPSIAVIPFQNLSNEASQEYISDGIMEAILNHLNKLEGLRLTSRTTMETYKGTKKTVPQIAEEVGVRFVLEGSVQRVGNTIRINAQLIDGKNDIHVWSEAYDRNVNDLLTIQSEVAQEIASRLAVKIKPTALSEIEAVPTKNAEAYDLYLRASHVRNWDDSIAQYRLLLERAIKLDPEFAGPYSLLGWYWVRRGFVDLNSYEVVQKAEPLFNKALSLNKDELSAHYFLGMMSVWYKWDFYSSEREFNYAEQLEPANHASLYLDLRIAMGQFDRAVEYARRRVAAEPKNIYYKIDLGFALYWAGKHDEALKHFDSVRVQAQPDRASYSDMSRVYFYLGQYERAAEVTEIGLRATIHRSRKRAFLAMDLIHLDKMERALQLLSELEAESKKSSVGSPAFHVAMIYTQLGKFDVAFQWLEKAYDAHEVEMYWLKVEPPFEPLHKDPRWKVMLKRVGFAVE